MRGRCPGGTPERPKPFGCDRHRIECDAWRHWDYPVTAQAPLPLDMPALTVNFTWAPILLAPVVPPPGLRISTKVALVKLLRPYTQRLPDAANGRLIDPGQKVAKLASPSQWTPVPTGLGTRSVPEQWCRQP